ncbi:metallopeptidase M24 family protein [Chlamydia ibidis]|uniref:Metallopeptidase M24 family protein n=2 Tax=Chlamydia ibidis TaxID=1405396 RepID=S7J394_9CHLA|nr:aminopeptidase P family protein [Chlamydia ibidis]EPP34502.1 metallopeptidase M24 family protein [Chlamydia ibidis]EQM62232.1 metallopeptidase M24 family protein [Chlamydia ibidis 10-1398/6]
MLHDRIIVAQHALSEYGIDAILVERDEDVSYFLYDQVVSGTLLIGKNEAVFFVNRMDRDLYSSLEGVRSIFCENTVLESLGNFLKTSSYQAVGFDSVHTGYAKYQDLVRIPCSWSPISLFCEKLRSVKDNDEIEKMKHAADLGSEGYDYILSILKEGITEKEVVHLVRAFWMEKGVLDVSFSPIIAFGEHAAFPHAIPTDRRLGRGDIVLIDIGVLYQGYCSDMSRTVSYGRPHDCLLNAYSAVLEAQKSAMDMCADGVACIDIYREAVRVLEQYKLEKYFFHGLGHGVGRNIHEYPFLSPKDRESVLRSGMVVTIEPGVYFPGTGGIRIEDSILINEKHYFNLTNRPVSQELVCL